MFFSLLKHLFQDFEGDTVMPQNVITRTKQLGLNLSVLGLAKVLWTFSRPLCLERLGNVLKDILDP